MPLISFFLLQEIELFLSVNLTQQIFYIWKRTTESFH